MSQRNRALIESLLTAPERRLLRQLCRLVGIVEDRWMVVRPLAELFEQRCWWRLGERLHVEQGVPMPTALNQAARLLGRKPGTLARRLRRWLEAAERGQNVRGVP